MKRFIEDNLLEWKNDPERKPLILSGARQVGKSYVIEQNLAPHFEDSLTINFEKQPEFKNCFSDGFSAKEILKRMEALSRHRINIEKTLLFWDEIQFCPKALTSLRYFYEEIPKLHIIAAGSLIEFILDKLSIPVGRVTYRHLDPISFEEFLFNSGNKILLDEIFSHRIDKTFPEALHLKAIALVKEYMAIGGMPEVIANYIEHNDYLKCQEILSDLIESYIKDFPKYTAKNTDLKYIDVVFSRAPHLVGNQFKFVQISRDIQSKYLREALVLLFKAGIINYIHKTAGFPLGANYNPHRFKLLFLDIGLMQRACDFNISRWISDSTTLINTGSITEQFVGQQILANSGFKRKRLYYWERDKKSSSAELDYLVEHNNKIAPIEVKAGAFGKLKSMKLFLESYPQIPEGIKVSLDNFGKQQNIRSIPLYAFGSWLKKSTPKINSFGSFKK